MKRILPGLADIIFPPRCLTYDTILDHHGKFPVCPTCSSKINFIKSPLCTRCGIPFSGADVSNHFCGDCSISKPAFTTAHAVGHYKIIFLEAIHNFKYKGEIAGMFAIPLDFLTPKGYIHTESQIRLGKKERASNVVGAFNVTKQDRVENRKSSWWTTYIRREAP